ncbi:MAG: oligopeptide ABC transporter permease AppB [Candidatus Dormibacteraceae bacterium]
MFKYLIRRTLQSVPLLVIISVLLFAILQLQPEKPWDQLLHRPNISAAEKAHILAYYGFDKPIIYQYFLWVWNLVHLDFGTSYFSHQSTLSLVQQRFPNTVILMGFAYVVTLSFAIPIGIISAVKQYSRFDNIVTTGAFLGFSLPNFWFGLMLIIGLAVFPYEHFGFKIFPTSGMSSEFGPTGWPLIWQSPIDLLWHLALPSLVLAVQFIASYSRFTRGAMLEVMNQDFIRTARAKGLGERKVVLRHAFRNALLPLITLMGLDIPRLFVGALVTEQVFAWPGMGRLFWESAQRLDYQVLMGILILLAVLVVAGNLVADLAYGWADPRIQYR